MDAKTCIETRRSVRRFQEKPVSRDLISQVVKLAQMAPTWKNSQTVRYIWIDDTDLKARIADEGVMGFARRILPFFRLNLGGVVPALIGFAIGMIIHFRRTKA